MILNSTRSEPLTERRPQKGDACWMLSAAACTEITGSKNKKNTCLF